MKKDRPSQHNTFPLLELLPPDLLSLIVVHLELKHLITLFLSCRHMHESLTSTGQHLDLSPYAQHVTPDILTRLIEKFSKKLVSVNLNGCSNMTDDALNQLAEKYNEKLVALDLTGCSQITDDTLTALAKYCTKLTSINLARCPHITHSAIENLAKECTLLPKVNLIDYSQPSRQALVDLCDELRDIGLDSDSDVSLNDAASRNLSIHLNRLTTFLAVEDSPITNESVTFLADHCPNLEICDFNRNPQLTSASLTQLAEKCHQLTDLGFSYCEDIDKAVEALAHNCPQLKKMRLVACYVGDAALMHLFRGCKEMRDLCLMSNAIGDEVLEAIAIHCKKLQSLDFVDNNNVTDRGVVYLAMHLVDLDIEHDNNLISWNEAKEYVALEKNLPHSLIELIDDDAPDERLHLYFDPCEKEYTTPAVFDLIVARFTQLTSIDLTQCTKLNNDSMGKLSENCPQLKVVDISWCYKIYDINSLIENCPHLEEINLSHTSISTRLPVFQKSCHQLKSIALRELSLSDDAIIPFITNCLQLEAIDLAGTQITQVTLEVLKKLGRSLKKVDLSYCEGISNIDATVMELVDACPELHSIGLNSLNVKDSTIDFIAKKCKNLQRIELNECKHITPAAMDTLAINFDTLEVKANDGLPTFAQAKETVRVACDAISRIAQCC